MGTKPFNSLDDELKELRNLAKEQISDRDKVEDRLAWAWKVYQEQTRLHNRFFRYIKVDKNADDIVARFSVKRPGEDPPYCPILGFQIVNDDVVAFFGTPRDIFENKPYYYTTTLLPSANFSQIVRDTDLRKFDDQNLNSVYFGFDEKDEAPLKLDYAVMYAPTQKAGEVIIGEGKFKALSTAANVPITFFSISSRIGVQGKNALLGLFGEFKEKMAVVKIDDFITLHRLIGEVKYDDNNNFFLLYFEEAINKILSGKYGKQEKITLDVIKTNGAIFKQSAQPAPVDPAVATPPKKRSPPPVPDGATVGPKQNAPQPVAQPEPDTKPVVAPNAYANTVNQLFQRYEELENLVRIANGKVPTADPVVAAIRNTLTSEPTKINQANVSTVTSQILKLEKTTNTLLTERLEQVTNTMKETELACVKDKEKIETMLAAVKNEKAANPLLEANIINLQHQAAGLRVDLEETRKKLEAAKADLVANTDKVSQGFSDQLKDLAAKLKFSDQALANMQQNGENVANALTAEFEKIKQEREAALEKARIAEEQARELGEHLKNVEATDKRLEEEARQRIEYAKTLAAERKREATEAENQLTQKNIEIARLKQQVDALNKNAQQQAPTDNDAEKQRKANEIKAMEAEATRLEEEGRLDKERENKRLTDEAERLKLEGIRQLVEEEKLKNERTRLAAEKKKLEDDTKRLADEKKKLEDEETQRQADLTKAAQQQAAQQARDLVAQQQAAQQAQQQLVQQQAAQQAQQQQPVKQQAAQQAQQQQQQLVQQQAAQQAQQQQPAQQQAAQQAQQQQPAQQQAAQQAQQQQPAQQQAAQQAQQQQQPAQQQAAQQARQQQQQPAQQQAAQQAQQQQPAQQQAAQQARQQPAQQQAAQQAQAIPAQAPPPPEQRSNQTWESLDNHHARMSTMQMDPDFINYIVTKAPTPAPLIIEFLEGDANGPVYLMVKFLKTDLVTDKENGSQSLRQSFFFRYGSSNVPKDVALYSYDHGATWKVIDQSLIVPVNGHIRVNSTQVTTLQYWGNFERNGVNIYVGMMSGFSEYLLSPDRKVAAGFHAIGLYKDSINKDVFSLDTLTVHIRV